MAKKMLNIICAQNNIFLYKKAKISKKLTKSYKRKIINKSS